ncbi:MAG TPA: superoxide dismutase, Ni [Verrucomicrobiae bacterium]|nr:superoxide dismutase, Ni [Verrucomicrobiae bacterium]
MWPELRSRLAPRRVVQAHCDIPCGIYDPHTAQLAAQTVETMVTKLLALQNDASGATHNNFVRMVAVKEEHAERVKREVVIIWGDYLKPEHLAQAPGVHDLVWRTLKLASACKQSIDAAKAAELRQAVDEFAAIFRATKK